jgi:hypothetical protein
MFGKDAGDWERDSRGLIPRAAEALFGQIAEGQKNGSSARISVFVSFLEIYLEQVRDLGYLVQSGSAPGSPPLGKDRRGGGGGAGAASYAATDHTNLEIYEDPSGMTLVKDLTYIEVTSAADVLALLKAGYALRQTAATGQNDVSSRSHTVFTLSAVQYRDGGQQPITGRLHLVDLAGSERLDKSYSDGQRLTETKSINKSLVALGKVVMSLASQGPGGGVDGADKGHVPFRDSKLTRLLKDSLQVCVVKL